MTAFSLRGPGKDRRRARPFGRSGLVLDGKAVCAPAWPEAAKKLGEEAVETVIAAVRRRAGELWSPKAPTSSTTCWSCWRVAGVPLCRGHGRTGAPDRAIRLRREGVACRPSDRYRADRWTSSPRPRQLFALPVLLRRALGGVPRRHAADALGRRGRSACARSTIRSTSTRCGASICRCRACSTRMSRPAQGCFRQRRRFFNAGTTCARRRSSSASAGSVAVGKSTTARVLQGAAAPLAVEPEGRPHHHRRLPAAQRGAAPRRADGAQGLSGELRCRRAAALPLRHQGGRGRTSGRRSIRT